MTARLRGTGVCFEMKNTSASTGDQLILQGVHVELTDAMKNMASEKFASLFRREDEIVRITARVHQDQTMGTERLYSVTAQMEIRGPDLVAHAQGKDVYALFDEVVENLDTQLRKRAGKRKDKRNHPHAVELDATLPKADLAE